jgi:hypothetical protein
LLWLRSADREFPGISASFLVIVGRTRLLDAGRACWKHEGVLDAMQARLDRMPDAMGIRRQAVEHPFVTLKSWMGSSHFLTRTLYKMRTEMSLHVLAYNVKRMIAIFGIAPLLQANPRSDLPERF